MNTKIKNITGASPSAKPASGGQSIRPIFEQYHYSAALSIKSAVIKEISRGLSDKIEPLVKSIKVANGNVILVLAPDGVISKHSITGFKPRKTPFNSLVFICVSSAAAATGWAHSIGGRWAIKINTNNQYPRDTIIGLIVGWVTAGNYTRIYENLDAAALASLMKYFHDASKSPPHRLELVRALKAQIRARVVASSSV